MQGNNQFVPFGPDHLMVLLGLSVATIALIVSGRWLRTLDDLLVRRGLAAVLITQELVAWLVGLTEGRLLVPFQLCDFALWLPIWALLSLRPRVGELAFFLALGGSLQAIVTPDLGKAFPNFWWFSFFLGHCSVVLSVVYLAVTYRVRPTQRSVWRVWLIVNVYAVAAGMLNFTLGTNFGYLARKPMQPSVLDYFGPWPYYILAMEAIALVSFYLYYAPFVLARRIRRQIALKEN